MIHRKTVVAIVVFLALAFLVASHNDSNATSLGERISAAGEETLATYRPSGLVFTTQGDPDELATHKASAMIDHVFENGGDALWARGRSDEWARIQALGTWRYLLLLFRSGVMAID